MHVTPDSNPRDLDELRDNVTAKLAELHRRATRAGRALSSWQRPWIRLALAAALGLALGWRHSRRDA